MVVAEIGGFYAEIVDKSYRFLLLVPFQERCRQAIKLPGFKQMRWEVVDMRIFIEKLLFHVSTEKKTTVISQQCS